MTLEYSLRENEAMRLSMPVMSPTPNFAKNFGAKPSIFNVTTQMGEGLSTNNTTNSDELE